MKLSFVIGSALVLAAVHTAVAQDARFGIMGGAMVGVHTTGDAAMPSQGGVGGWGLGVTYGPVISSSIVSLRIDAGFSKISGVNFRGPAFDCAQGVTCSSGYSSDYAIAGISAGIAANVIGAEHQVVPYVIGSVGWYGLRESAQVFSFDGVEVKTAGALGYGGGIGVRMSRFFLEARASVISNVPTSAGTRENLVSWPIAFGFRF
jgi:hypothetical protein